MYLQAKGTLSGAAVPPMFVYAKLTQPGFPLTTKAEAGRCKYTQQPT